MSETVGELFETRGELDVEWKISEIFSLLEVEGECRRSPLFYYSGSSWYLKVYSNGKSKSESIGCIGVYLVRRDSGSPKILGCSLGIKTANGEKVKTKDFTKTFDKNEKASGHGFPNLLNRSELMAEKSNLVPSNILTVVCTLKCKDSLSLGESLFDRLSNLSSDLKVTLSKEEETDVVLKAGEREFRAHRLILGSRSSVFSAMFIHDTAEKQTGVVNIRNIASDAFKCVLPYMYCGEVEGLSNDNVFDIYVASHKYGFTDLKLRCKAFISNNLCVERVCKIIQFAMLHKEEKLARLARRYFKINMKQVVETDQWKTLSEKYPKFAVDVVTTSLKESE